MQTQESGQLTNDITTSPTSAGQTWREFALPWWQATKAVLPVYLITRLVFLLLTYFSGILFFVPNYSTEQLSAQGLLYNWYRWDTIRFITVAQAGYVSPDFAAFFPLYPALERVMNKLTHIDILICGLLISNLAMLGTLIVLHRLTEREFDRETAGRTILYLSIFPTALFLFAAYNESLFLFFMLLCFYSLRRGSWWFAGLFGFLATLTRSIGLFMMPIFVCEYVVQHYPQLRQYWQGRKYKQMLDFIPNLLPILLIPIALAIFAFGLYRRFGDPLAFDHAQMNWREPLSFPWTAPGIALKELFANSLLTFDSAHLIIDLTALFFFLALLVLCFVGPERLEKRHWTFALFGIMALFYSIIFPGIPGAIPGAPYDPIPSMQRFVLEIFIGFIIMARFGRRPWFHQSYLLISLPMLGFFVIQFLTGHWTI
jgi:Gpi18-like mannosyltransferase